MRLLCAGPPGLPGRVARAFDVITIAVGPSGVAPLEREDPEFGRKARGRVGDTAVDQRGGHGGREADALDGVACLERSRQ